jgi:hypothetical protein
VKEEETKLNWKMAGKQTIMTIHLPNERGNKSTEMNNIKRRKKDFEGGFIQSRRKEIFSQFN